MELDIGPQSIERVKGAIDEAETLVWNGPLGAFEMTPFDAGTVTVARHAAERTGAGARTLMRMAPEGMSRNVGFRAAAKIAAQQFDAELRGSGKSVEARIDDPLSIAAMPEGEACAFYGAMFAELVRVLAEMEGTMTHDRCRSRGDAACVWRWAAAEGYR